MRILRTHSSHPASYSNDNSRPGRYGPHSRGPVFAVSLQDMLGMLAGRPPPRAPTRLPLQTLQGITCPVFKRTCPHLADNFPRWKWAVGLSRSSCSRHIKGIWGPDPVRPALSLPGMAQLAELPREECHRGWMSRTARAPKQDGCSYRPFSASLRLLPWGSELKVRDVSHLPKPLNHPFPLGLVPASEGASFHHSRSLGRDGTQTGWGFSHFPPYFPYRVT